MLDLSILTPRGAFPDLATQAVIADLGGREVANTLGQASVVQEISYVLGTDGPTIRYLMEPELQIPCILVTGDGHRALSDRLEQKIDCIDALHAALSFTDSADATVKVTLLRILSAHALEGVSEPMTSVALRAARDSSPFVRLGAVQLAQYANDAQITRIITDVLMPDADPDVQAFAEQVVSNQA